MVWAEAGLRLEAQSMTSKVSQRTRGRGRQRFMVFIQRLREVIQVEV
jgi:hypothetical protein